MKELHKMRFGRRKWCLLACAILFLAVVSGSFWLNSAPFRNGFEITDELGGNLVRTPGHMFVGYYTDSEHKHKNFLETTMIGDIDLDDFFPDEKLDSTMAGKSQNQMSRLTFDKSKQYANKKYKENEENIHSGKLNYMFLEISKEVRRKIQPIGK